MKFEKSPFEGMSPPSFASVVTLLFAIALESAMFVMFYAVYTETIGLMSDTYLSELPVIGMGNYSQRLILMRMPATSFRFF